MMGPQKPITSNEDQILLKFYSSLKVEDGVEKTRLNLLSKAAIREAKETGAVPKIILRQ